MATHDEWEQFERLAFADADANDDDAVYNDIEEPLYVAVAAAAVVETAIVLEIVVIVVAVVFEMLPLL